MLTRLARHIPLLALVGCAAHAPASAAAPIPAPASPAPVPPPGCAVVHTDSLHIDVTAPMNPTAAMRVPTRVAASSADTTLRGCGTGRWAFLVRTIDPRAARDALDAGIDMVLTADPAAGAYADHRPEY